jgi:hypothetical protein
MQQMAQRMLQAPAAAEALAAPAAQINIWEEDPFSEETPTANPAVASTITVSVPVNNHTLLQTRIVDPAPPAGPYPVGSANFRYWVAAVPARVAAAAPDLGLGAVGLVG